MSPQSASTKARSSSPEIQYNEVAERLANQFLNLENEESFLKEVIIQFPESVQEKVVECVHANIDHVIGFSWLDSAGCVTPFEQLVSLRERFGRAKAV